MFRITVVSQTSDEVVVSAGSNKVAIQSKPFRLDFYSGDDLVAVGNGNGLMRFEHIREKPEP